MRRAVIDRRTTETQIALTIALDGKGHYDVRTGIRFLDHMLELFARHDWLQSEGSRQLGRRRVAVLLRSELRGTGRCPIAVSPALSSSVSSPSWE